MRTFPRRRPLCVAAVGVLLSIAFTASAAAATHVVVIDQMKYGPVPPLRVGDTVAFVNKDMFRHTVTARNNKFNLDLLPGARGSLRINSVGRALFSCKYHPRHARNHGGEMSTSRSLAIDYAALSDLDLARRCGLGDVDAVRHLVTNNNQRLFRTAWSILRNRQEAEDVLQSSYAKALGAIGRFEGRSSLPTWLTRITINEALAHRRTQERRRRNLEAEGVEVLENYREQLAKGSHAPSPEAEAAREQLRSILERAIGELPENFRTVFVLHEIEGVSVEEAAQALEIPTGTVKTRLMRARRKLQQALAPEVRTALTGAFPFAGADCARLTEQVIARFLEARGG